MSGSVATSHETAIVVGAIPPSGANGSNARRVQRTTLVEVGSPEAIPRVNGGGEGENAAAVGFGRRPAARSAAVPPFSSERRVRSSYMVPPAYRPVEPAVTS